MFEHLMTHPDELPGDAGELSLHRRVCDFIAGMTDRYFLGLYKSRLL
jgi:dGTP triphosphohydrolase